MWYNTKMAKLLGVQYPIFQGPFGGNFSSIKLAATVSNMVGVGSYSADTLAPDELFKVNEELRKATDKPYNINLWVSDSDVPGGTASEAALKRVKDLFRPYFDEVGIELPDQTLSFTSRWDNQVDVILRVKPPIFSFMF